MIVTFSLALALAQAPSPSPAQGPIYSGRESRTSVAIPRIDADIEMNGMLDEAAWRDAAVLTGFSQYAPTDGLPAADSTQVLVWYSAHAIHFGIRAFESHGSPTATLPDRDRIFGDDNVQILLGTFHDGRQALMFAVNPRGVQADGALIDGRNTGTGGSFISSAVSGREQADLSPDYVWQSRGRLTEFGYEVEVRIPFKSLRYQSTGGPQSWNVHVLRQVKHSGFEDSWAPALRASTSFLGQAGELTGLTDLRRGLVMDIQPEATNRVSGTPGTPSAPAYRYTREDPQLGANVRWGITNNLALNGTVHPDFSQVESDAGQLAFDPRLALFFPEKRPFFLEGNELFAVPSNLIYTRRIVQPVAAVKLAGNLRGTNIGLLTAVDDEVASRSGNDNPFFAIVRVQRNIGARSRIGFAYTDRTDAGNYNRVADIDGRLVFRNIYTLNFQYAHSLTRTAGVRTDAPLWSTSFSARGRRYGVSAIFSGIGDDFRTQSGFTSRAGIVRANIDPSFTLYGRRGALLERFTGDILYDGTWQYQKFIHNAGVQDEKLHFRTNFALRGGWNLAAAVLVETFGYDAGIYANYRLEVPAAGGGGALDTIPFVGQPTIANLDYIVSLNTPQWRHFSAFAFYLWGNDENFFEWASGAITWANVGLTWRPTERIRTEYSYNLQKVNRRTDGSLVNLGQISRLKLEYQVSRPFFIRVVGQYRQEQTDSLRDDSRTNAPILIVTPAGIVRTVPEYINQLHADVLLSWQPTPGTTVLAGYGSDMTDAGRFRFERLTRQGDAFFVKVSWLFRM